MRTGKTLMPQSSPPAPRHAVLALMESPSGEGNLRREGQKVFLSRRRGPNLVIVSNYRLVQPNK